MSTKTSTASSGGVSFCSLLTVLFIGLKLTNHIDWSWWWVLAPMWLPISVVLGICLVVVVVCGIIMGTVSAIGIVMDIKRKGI